MRCPWPKTSELMIAYHDQEWGVPVHNDRKLFEFIVLDAFQAGLNWSMILGKREDFRHAFDNFEPAKIARYTPRKLEALAADTGIVRNRLKIAATVSNAQAFLETQEEFGSFDRFVWDFVGGTTKQNKWKTLEQLPVTTRESDRLSHALIDRGFKFAGSTICYAFMQAAGLVNDHITSCFRYSDLGGS